MTTKETQERDLMDNPGLLLSTLPGFLPAPWNNISSPALTFRKKIFQGSGPFERLMFTNNDRALTNYGEILELKFSPSTGIIMGVLNQIPIILKLQANGNITSTFCPIRGTAEEDRVDPPVLHSALHSAEPPAPS